MNKKEKEVIRWKKMEKMGRNRNVGKKKKKLG